MTKRGCPASDYFIEEEKVSRESSTFSKESYALSPKITGFLSCHPVYDDHVMHLTLDIPYTLQYYKLMPQQLSCSYQAGEAQ
eukprot:1157817-Pelagomonas_calceolata.AAC.24